MKNKGFTLIELLGTIIILSLIVILAFPSIIAQLKRSNDTIDNSVKRIVEVAARDYVNDHINDYVKPASGSQDFDDISVCDLKDNGYLDDSYLQKHPEIKNGGVSVSASSKKYTITYKQDVGDTEC